MISRNSIKLGMFMLVLFFGAFQAAYAQGETATITGTVTDQANAPVPGATVQIKSTLTGLTRTTTTSDDGTYVIANVQPSTYEIIIKSGNFKEYKLTRDISVASQNSVNATLSASVGAVVDIVATGTDVGEINISDQTVSEVVNDKQLQNLPTITRNPYDFINTLGNVSQGDNGGRGVGVAINGQRSASTSILLNGGENVDNFTAVVGQSVPLDSVEEYRVTTGTFTADTGRATGGVVNLITKSGANRFFGTAYLFNRNSKLASAGFDANANGIGREFFNRNQFGFSVGGPIVKDKLLFFTNTEWTRIRSNETITAYVPSAASIAASSPATQAFFAGQTLAGRLTGRTGTLTGTSGRVFTFNEIQYTVPGDTGAGTPSNGVQSANRIDWNASDRFQLYGVYALDRNTAFDGTNGNNAYAGFNTGTQNRNTNIQVAATYSLTNSFVGVSRATYNKLDNDQPLSSAPVQPTLYLRNIVARINGDPIAFPGYLPFAPGSAIPFGGPQKVYNLSQEFNWNLGNHLIKFGGQYYRILDDRVFGAYQNAVATLNSTNTAGAIDNLFDGVVQRFQVAINPQGRFPGQTITTPVTAPQFGRNNQYSEYAFYGMDSVKIFPGFTANFGLRYEYYGPQANKDRALDSNFYFGGDGTFNAANVRTGSVRLTANSPDGELWKADKNNFAPSVGFAYDIEGNGKSSLRAGYALRYERNFGNVTFNVIQNPPNYAVIDLANVAITRNNFGPLATAGGTATLYATSLRAVDPNIKNAYAHQYSASYERRFSDFTTSATFSGSTGKSLYSIANINRQGSGLALLGSNDTTRTCSPTNVLGSTASTVIRLNCQYGDINFRGNGGYSSYQGITFAVESGNFRRTGLTLASRYTYSVARDNLSTTFSETGNQFNLGFLDAYDPALDYGFSDFDVRHRWINSFVWDIPTNRMFDGGIGRTVFGDFTVSGIINIQSGSPYTVYDCFNGITTCTRLIPNGNVDRGGSLGTSVGTNRNVYNPLTGQASVELLGGPRDIRPGENGFLPVNMDRRNLFRGPGFWNVDMAVAKKFSFTERTFLQLRVDAQNLFNHANAFINGGTADIAFEDNASTVSRFGRRQIQLGIRLGF